jgi:predicted P-loop ATPase
MDLDEGSSLTRSDSIKIKSVITETHDEYRAPYDRLMKKYPRRFVFSMSTNDDEPFRDLTGNRRYWVIQSNDRVDFVWLEENRDQLFAEAYDAFINKRELPNVPWDEAESRQNEHMPDDSWSDLVCNQVKKSSDYCTGSPLFSTSVAEVYGRIFPEASLDRLNRSHEMRITNIFKKNLGLMKKQSTVNGERKMRWMLTPEKSNELNKNNATDTQDWFDKV